MIEHPSHERLSAFVDRRLDPSSVRIVAAHLSDCDTCLAAVGASVRLSAAVRRTTGRIRWVAAAVWLASVAAGLTVPVGPPPTPASVRWREAPRTYAHIDFESMDGFVLAEGRVREVRVGNRTVTSAGAVRSDGWWIVSVRLPEPIVIGEACTMRIELQTTAGYGVASLFPLGKDAAFVRLEPGPASGSWTTVVANLGQAPKAGSVLRPGDLVDRLTIGVPASAADPEPLLVRAIELRASR